jgi:fructokinase
LKEPICFSIKHTKIFDIKHSVPYKVGIDLGGTKIECIIINYKNEEVWRKRIPTEQEKGYNVILENIRSLYSDAVLRINKEEHTLGIGIPGTISNKTKLIKNSNTQCLNNKLFKQDIIQVLNHNAEIQNDANCFTFAEAILGAGVGKNLVFGVIMGTGCGGGISINGKIYSGIQGIAGEWGHMQINPEGPKCYCSKKGCVETYISGSGIQKLFEKKYEIHKTMQEITIGYRNGKTDCSEMFKQFIKYFGIALSNVINILDPDIVVLGGGLSNIDELYTVGIDEVKKNIFSDSFETKIVKNYLGDSSGVIGAALIGVS